MFATWRERFGYHFLLHSFFFFFFSKCLSPEYPTSLFFFPMTNTVSQMNVKIDENTSSKNSSFALEHTLKNQQISFILFQFFVFFLKFNVILQLFGVLFEIMNLLTDKLIFFLNFLLEIDSEMYLDLGTSDSFFDSFLLPCLHSYDCFENLQNSGGPIFLHKSVIWVWKSFWFIILEEKQNWSWSIILIVIFRNSNNLFWKSHWYRTWK